MSIPDPYKILQVDPEAEDEVIEAAYRRLARKYHPDVASGPDPVERMVRINQAWEILRDPVRRAAVDRARERASMVGSVPGADTGADAASADRRGPGDVGNAPGAEGQPGATGQRGETAQPTAGWPKRDMGDPAASESKTPPPERVSRDWTTGRSTTGSTYDPSAMRTPEGRGAAGPPPGRPSGSVLNFGRYAGWSLGEILRTDVEYVEWLDRMPIGRMYQQEIDALLRTVGRRTSAPPGQTDKRGLFRRR